LITVLPEIMRAASEYRMLAYGIAVILIINLYPTGLMGYKEFTFAAVQNTWFKFRNLVRR
jgi:branched-chain amino acid transport system permease protein